MSFFKRALDTIPSYKAYTHPIPPPLCSPSAVAARIRPAASELYVHREVGPERRTFKKDPSPLRARGLLVTLDRG